MSTTTSKRGMRASQHGSFTLERVYDATSARVFAAWASAEAKARWFAGPDEWAAAGREFDFRVGGREYVKGRWKGGTTSTFDARYFDIVPDRRIVYAYDMYVDDAKISVSLTTVEITPEGRGTRLRFTEQAVFLDGYDDAGSRERGTGALLDNLGRALEVAEPAH
ncbi:MAG: SRPBCC family protein [Candidatus Levyibacteriota bacterium]